MPTQEVPEVSLSHFLCHPKQSSQQIAIQFEEQAISYAQLNANIAKARGWLRKQGLEEQAVIAIQTPKSLTFIELVLACFAERLIVLPLNPQYTSRELHYYLEDSNAKLIVTPLELAAQDISASLISLHSLQRQLCLCEPHVADSSARPEDAAMLMYTSGTTGRPKGAVLSHANIEATVTALYEAWDWSSNDILLHALPLFHVHGLFVAQFTALRAGATTIWMERFDATETFKAIQQHRPSIFMGVPTFYNRLLRHVPVKPPVIDSLRLFTSGSAPLSAETHQHFSARFGLPILERYGMTEIGIVLSNPINGERRPGSVGFPLPGVEARIAHQLTNLLLPDGEIGEVQIKGPSVFKYYLNRPDATKRTFTEAWMKTGDLGFRDADGYYNLVGRATDLIICGGMNVYPNEVVSTLCEHSAVTEASVFGVPDNDLGERVVAFIVGAPELSGLRDWLRERLAGYKCPREYRYLDALPRNAMGKLDRAAILQCWKEGHGPETT